VNHNRLQPSLIELFGTHTLAACGALDILNVWALLAQSKGILAAIILQQKALKCEFVRACMYLFIWDAICTAYRCTSLPRESFLLSTHRQYFELLTITNLKLCCVVQKSNTTTGAVQRMETQELSLSLIFSKCDDFEGAPAS
jgi:hypothetical protein